MSAAMQGLGSVLGLVIGGALTVINWRLAFLINLPIGALIIWIAVTRLEETRHERLKLDITGALLATLGCTAAVLVFTQGPPRGWTDPFVIGAGVAAVALGIGFVIAERNADHPLVPLSLFSDRNRVMTFISLFMAGGVMLTLTVIIGLYVQDVLGYSALHAGIGFIPFALALGLGNVLTARLAPACRTALADHRRRRAGAGRHALRLHPDAHHPVLPGPAAAHRRRRLRHRGDLGDPAAVRGGRRRPPRDRPGQCRSP